MPEIAPTYDEGFSRGYKSGHEDGMQQGLAVRYEPPQSPGDLTAHDLDTIAMGIALIVLHAADTETIAATMDTQLKLGIANKVLGWLRLIAEQPYNRVGDVSLHETTLNPWLNPGAPTPFTEEETDQIADWFTNDPDAGDEREAPYDIPF